MDQILCPIHQEPLEKVSLTQGDLLLGYLWLCPLSEWGSKKGDCDYVLGADAEGNPIFDDDGVCSEGYDMSDGENL